MNAEAPWGVSRCGDGSILPQNRELVRAVACVRRTVPVQILATAGRNRPCWSTDAENTARRWRTHRRRIFAPTAAAASQDLSEMKQPCGRTSELQPAGRRPGWRSVYRPAPDDNHRYRSSAVLPGRRSVGCNEPSTAESCVASDDHGAGRRVLGTECIVSARSSFLLPRDECRSCATHYCHQPPSQSPTIRRLVAEY